MQRVESTIRNLEPQIREIFLNPPPPAESLHGEPPNDSLQPDDEVEQGVDERAEGEAESGEGQHSQPQQEAQQPRCPICLEQMDTITTPCDHTFHVGCLEPWVLEKGNCPICRSAISMQDISQPD